MDLVAFGYHAIQDRVCVKGVRTGDAYGWVLQHGSGGRHGWTQARAERGL